MNSTCSNQLLANNLALFTRRFPQLTALCREELDAVTGTPEPDLEITAARNGMPTARFCGIQLHSAYDPAKEAERDMAPFLQQDCTALVLLGIGLGYHAVTFARQKLSVPLIIIEPSLHRLLSAMSVIDFSPVFSLPELIICPGAQTPAIIALLEQQGIESCAFLNKSSLQTHAPHFFESLWNLIQRNKEKNAINRRTLKKFSGLWFRNMCRNTAQLALCEGITRFQDCLNNQTPAVVVAAGPTLDHQIQLLKELQNTCMIICVDTALRALLNHHITPHFIVLCDPQYYNARHIEGLSAPESILITESAAYPSVFRFHCKEIVLCSSMFPLGAYIEKQIGLKGVLGTGGSVSATAWDFARYCGASSILLIGLDLGFPQKKTHTKGSTFEEKTFSASKRTAPAETALTNVLFSPITVKKQDYQNKELLSDRRMEMYAWWFESKCQEHSQLKTYTASSSSLAIPGIIPVTDSTLIQFTAPEYPFAGMTLLAASEDALNKISERQDALQQALRVLEEDLSAIEAAIIKADDATQSCSQTQKDQQQVLSVLSETDRQLLTSPVKELLNLIIPTQDDLKAEYDSLVIPEDPAQTREWRTAMAHSHILYQHTLQAVHTWQAELFQNKN